MYFVTVVVIKLRRKAHAAYNNGLASADMQENHKTNILYKIKQQHIKLNPKLCEKEIDQTPKLESRTN
jgi:hypothetical protein